MKKDDVIYFTVSPNESLNFDGILTYIEIEWPKEEEQPSESEPEPTTEEPEPSEIAPIEEPKNQKNNLLPIILGSGLGVAVLAAGAVVLIKKKKEKSVK